ncbi:phospholipid carrier-dependent glycosyltransferase [Candidatus Woesebacteria bacterium]|nr:phospholipid carrier-dependent glycosyltransferase [Candidatus Woesebacteria bacterium]
MSVKESSSFFTKTTAGVISVFFVLLYLLTHLIALVKLPVFSDEAIYIRWAQLIMDEPLRYLFFPLNDGKTPLFIWLLVPFQYIFSDQLYAGRFLSVLVGLGQLAATDGLVRRLGGRGSARIAAALSITLLPYWYFHHRMALMDGMLTFWLTLTVLFLIRSYQEISSHKKQTAPVVFTQQLLLSIMLSVGAFGAALWSKLPALLVVPSFAVLLGITPLGGKKICLQKIVTAAAVFFGGIACFLLLRISPAFGQLFSRGSDFLFPLQAVLFEGRWRETLPSTPNYIYYFIAYLSLPSVVLPPLALLCKNRHYRAILSLLLAAGVFLFPIMLLGKVVYPRYLLPAALFITPAAALAFEALVEKMNTIHSRFNWAQLTVGITILLFTMTSTQFLLANWFNPDALPFVSADQEQYLTKWSSGHGIAEVTQSIKITAKSGKIAVATEGSFGTLPDGILLYLHRTQVTNIWVEGIGQPVVQIPESFKTRVAGYDQIWLVVNADRMKLELPKEKLKTQYCRPYAAACLQVWDITEYVRMNH